jgi:uncharacterized integral membrane protein (TIGR00698 family)
MSLLYISFGEIMQNDMNNRRSLTLPLTIKEHYRTNQPSQPGHLSKVLLLLLTAVCLILWASLPTALLTGVLFAFFIGHPFSHWNHKITKYLLQGCVVLLGFGMNLPAVLRLGFHGSIFAAVTIGATLILGYLLGRKLELERNISTLIAVGTAICGGSAIAAVSSVIAATEAEIAVSIGVVFLLNAAALYIFPFVGHLLHLTQLQFGLWAGVGIHDISSVVGAGLGYGQEALLTAAAVKLSRTLWIVPITLGIAFIFGRGRGGNDVGVTGHQEHHFGRIKTSVPWFIGLFLLASLLRSYVPSLVEWTPLISEVAHRGMILVLFLVGTALSLRAVKTLGWRTIMMGVILWMFISVASLMVILFFP